MNRRKCLAILSAVVACGLFTLGAERPQEDSARVHAKVLHSSSTFGNIYTWAGNTPTWNQKLHVSGYRIGCATEDAAACLHRGLDIVRQEQVKKIIISIPIDPSRTADDALAYSQLSLSNPFLVEVSFDDFVGRYSRLFSEENISPSSWLQAVVRNFKAKNPALEFGITLYEDDLQSPYLREPYVPKEVSQSINDVHLYLHYRENVPNYKSYVQQAKVLFPNAKIIAGSYAYDRVNYIPCTPSDKQPCSPEKEIALYEKAIGVEAQLLKQGFISGIEFFPGFFGMENEWQGWKDPSYCDPARVQECIKNTLIMRQAAAETLNTTIGW